MRLSKFYWLGFLDWLAGGTPGVLPATLRWTYGGPIWRLAPLARQSAEAVGPWLLALLEARQQRELTSLPGLDGTAGGLAAADLLARDLQARPFKRGAAPREAGWLCWGLEAEVTRLVRLVVAPAPLLAQPGWLASQARCWALVVALVRLWQMYAALARLSGREAEQQWRAVADRVWQRATTEAQAA